MRAMTNTFEGNRVVRDTGCRYPILNAPVGYFARASLTGAISEAGGFGLMETSSQGLAETDMEFNLVRQRTDAPLGLQPACLAAPASTATVALQSTLRRRVAGLAAAATVFLGHSRHFSWQTMCFTTGLKPVLPLV